MIGYALLAIAALGAASGAVTLATVLLDGLTAARLMSLMSTFGLALAAGLFGWYVRMAATGRVLPSNADLSVGYCGGR